MSSEKGGLVRPVFDNSVVNSPAKRTPFWTVKPLSYSCVLREKTVESELWVRFHNLDMAHICEVCPRTKTRLPRSSDFKDTYTRESHFMG